MEQGEIQEPKDSGETPFDFSDAKWKVADCILCKGAGVLPGIEGRRCVLCLLILRFIEAHGGQMRGALEATLRNEANNAILSRGQAILDEVRKDEFMKEIQDFMED